MAENDDAPEEGSTGKWGRISARGINRSLLRTRFGEYRSQYRQNTEK